MRELGNMSSGRCWKSSISTPKRRMKGKNETSESTGTMTMAIQESKSRKGSKLRKGGKKKNAKPVLANLGKLEKSGKTVKYYILLWGGPG